MLVWKIFGRYDFDEKFWKKHRKWRRKTKKKNISTSRRNISNKSHTDTFDRVDGFCDVISTLVQNWTFDNIPRNQVRFYINLQITSHINKTHDSWNSWFENCKTPSEVVSNRRYMIIRILLRDIVCRNRNLFLHYFLLNFCFIWISRLAC